jgi:tetratricopeptide (TPR) repeat protein
MASYPPDRIGAYRVVDTLGEGGMGVVYLAEQSEPVRRHVALKVLKAGVDSREVLARFDAERQALAIMDHPSIAKIFDAGVTEDGRPWFAMERVEGVPIVAFCDTKRLTLRQRVRLFADVCAAVQHAHQKGVIHRDLKPSNVLVSEVDGKPLPRIIDFGIAKAAQGAGFDGTHLTTDDQIIGTPAYMSPEQIDGSKDIDTRADVYALGVLLYEVLVGALPHEAVMYRGWAAVVTTSQRDTPPPWKRFTELGDARAAIADARSATSSELRRELAGDLGWIVTRAMERDRERRYETANGMALDLRRYLGHEPVRARGTTTRYVVRKFVERHRIGVAFGATVAAGLVAFAVITSVQAGRIARARDEAEARRGQAEGLIDFMLTDLRKKLEPIGRLDVLDDVGDQAIKYFASIPRDQFTDAELASRSQALYQIGSVRLDQGNSPAAVAAFAESLRLAEELADRAPDDTTRLYGLAQSHFYVGFASWRAGDLPAAEQQFLGYMDAAQHLVTLSPENLDYRLELGFAHSNLGSVREARGDLGGAVEAYLLTLDAERSLVEHDSTNIDWVGELAETHDKLGVVYRKLGEYGRARDEHEAEIELKTHILGMDPNQSYWRYRLTWAMGFLADVLQATGELDRELSLRTRAVGALDSLVAQDAGNAAWRRAHAVALRGRADALLRLGRARQAAGSLDPARRELHSLLRADSTNTRLPFDLARVYVVDSEVAQQEGRHAAALVAADSAASLAGSDAGTTSTRAETVALAQLQRGRALEALGRPDEAVQCWALALSTLEPFMAGTDRNQFLPLHAEALLLLDRGEEARSDVEALRGMGYVDSRLSALARAKGIEN